MRIITASSARTLARGLAVGFTVLSLAGGSAPAAADPVKIGFLATLSGPSAVLGQHMRDGFLLAVKELGGKIGGQETQVIVVDDELKPDVAVQKAKSLMERDKVDFITGLVFSNVAVAVLKPVTANETFLISANAGPSTIAGAGCNPYFFAASYQNDQNHEVLGKFAQSKGYKRVVLMAPNYQAGKDALAGFKRHYTGEVVDEIYTQLGQLDFSAELAKVAAAKPDAFFTFMPGGMGVNLVKQYRQAGLADTIPFLSAFTVDETTLPATGDAALGFHSGAAWAPDLDVPANHAFVAAFEKEYGYIPALYAAQAYDAAKLIDSAVRATGGKLSDKQALRAALSKADFPSVRGDFKFNTNQFPIQNFYLMKVGRRPDGKIQTQVAERVFANSGDAYAQMCPMK